MMFKKDVQHVKMLKMSNDINISSDDSGYSNEFY